MDVWDRVCAQVIACNRRILIRQLSTAPLRLVGGSNAAEGRVEIYYGGTWGSVCDDGWDDNDATVVCKQLGYVSGTAYCCANWGASSGQIWLDDVGCTGSESALSVFETLPLPDAWPEMGTPHHRYAARWWCPRNCQRCCGGGRCDAYA